MSRVTGTADAAGPADTVTPGVDPGRTGQDRDGGRPARDGPGSALAPEPAPSTGTGSDSEPTGDRWADRLALLCLAAAILPIVVATVRAIADDWVAVGDNAYFAIRSADVLTEHHPWLGTWTSASQTVGIDMNNPGPLYFDLLAVPVKVGGDAGLAVAVALLNIAAIVGIGLVARRQAGPRGMVVAMLAAAGLGWALGSELLFDPWQPHSLMFPFLCFLVLVWGLANGDLPLLPWVVGLASFIVQTHIGYALVIPALGAWGLGALAVQLWRSRRSEPEHWTAQRRRTGHYLAVALAVGFVTWSQPIYEQLFGDGRGNLGRLAASADETQTRVGLGQAPRYVADVLALPPWWGRPSMGEAFAVSSTLPSSTASLAGLVAVGGLLVAATALARRRGGKPATTAALTGLVVLAVTLGAASTMPVASYGVAAHHLRWLWPVALFVTFVVALALVTSLGRGRGQAARVGLVGVTVATVSLGLLSLPSNNPEVGPSGDADAMPTIRALLPQLEPLRDERGVLFEVHGLRFAEPFSVPVMQELRRLGVPWYVDDPGMVRQLGDARAWPGDASVRLFLREGDAARETPAGADRIAFVEGLPEAEADELATLQDQLTPFIVDGGLHLTDHAAAEVRDPDTLNPDAGGVSETQLRDPDYLFAWGTASSRYSRQLVYLVEEDRLDVPARWDQVLERYAELQTGADRLTVAVFAQPLEEAA